VVAATVQAVGVLAVGAGLGWLGGGGWGAAAGGVGSAPAALVHASVVARGRPYCRGWHGTVLAGVDATWSGLNTWAGAWYVLIELGRGNRLDIARSTGAGVLFLERQAIPGYATTIGPVAAGCPPRIERHERVHVLQARLLGPFYLPLVALGFVVATVVPYWLVSSRARARVVGPRSYFERGVYPNTWHEWWAYRRG
jgi:hypothetical protein